MQCFYNWLIFIVVFLAVNSTKGQDVIFLMNTDEIQAQQIETVRKVCPLSGIQQHFRNKASVGKK